MNIRVQLSTLQNHGNWCTIVCEPHIPVWNSIEVWPILFFFVYRKIVAIAGQSFAIFASQPNGVLIQKKRIPAVQLEIATNAVKKDTYEWKLITHCTRNGIKCCWYMYITSIAHNAHEFATRTNRGRRWDESAKERKRDRNRHRMLFHSHCNATYWDNWGNSISMGQPRFNAICSFSITVKCYYERIHRYV